MTGENPKYDVAISFLSQDLNLAKALYDQLTQGLEVFFFPRNQEELAGTDGLESMREPFRSESRLNVVLYRPLWGKTRWTAVEEIAIKDSCLDTGFKSLFFFSIDSTNELPNWLPETHVRFNYADYDLAQAAGAIKARAQDRGSHIRPLTPLRKAEILQAEEDFRQHKSSMLSSETAVFNEVEALFAEVLTHLDQVNAGGHFAIQRKTKIERGQVEQFCTIGQDEVSMSLIWHQPYRGSLHDAILITREFDRLIILPPGYYTFEHPNILNEKHYLPDVSIAREYGWSADRGEMRVVCKEDFAVQFVMEFLDLLERDRGGKIRRHHRG